MPRLSKIWDKVEHAAIYVVISVFIIAELLGYMFPSIDNLLRDRPGFILISLVLLAMFRNLDRRLSQSVQGFTSTKSFGESVGVLLKGRRVIDTLEIFGHSTSKYYQFVKDGGVKIRKARILISGQLLFESSPYPHGQQERKSVKSHAELAGENWLRLQSQGVIEDLEIRYYNFWPTAHFMIVDGVSAQWGLFEPMAGGLGVTVQRVYLIVQESAMREFVEDLQKFFYATFTLSPSPNPLRHKLTTESSDARQHGPPTDCSALPRPGSDIA